MQPENLEPGPVMDELGKQVQNTNVAALMALHCFQLRNSIILIDPYLEFWVKPRSTIWLLCFVLEEYDDDR